MAAFFRVKRKKDNEPLDALLIACKRPKVESDDKTAESPLTAIVKFAGTVEKHDDCVVTHITKTLSKDILKANFKQHIVDVTKKEREKKQESNETRYKVVNSMRALDTSLAKQLEEDALHIIDIEDTKPIPDDKTSNGYVYDLYYTQTKEAFQLEDILSVLPVEEDLVFEDRYRDDENGHEGESEDSNSESNWKNDYPDSDHSDASVKENDIQNAMKNLNVEDDLSSDSDDLVYGLDEEDVDKYGFKYAHYKARMKKEGIEYDGAVSANGDSDDMEEFDDDYPPDD